MGPITRIRTITRIRITEGTRTWSADEIAELPSAAAPDPRMSELMSADEIQYCRVEWALKQRGYRITSGAIRPKRGTTEGTTELRVERIAVCTPGNRGEDKMDDITVEVPAPKTEEEENVLLDRALDLAEDICTPIGLKRTWAAKMQHEARSALTIAAENCAPLARAFGILTERFDWALTQKPVGAKCMWCLEAAGDTQEAWEAIPMMSLEEIRRHIMICQHGPVVAALAVKATKQ